MNIQEQLRFAKYARLNLIVGYLGFFYLLGLQVVLMPTLYPAIITEMDWTRAEGTLYASLKFISGGIMAFFSGFVIDRIGLKQTLFWVIVTKIIVMSFFLFVQEIWLYYLIALFNGASGILGVVALHTLIAQWFIRNQGRAHGLALLGSATAGILVPICGQYLSEIVGWRMTIFSVNLLFGVLLMPFLLKALRAHPAEFGFKAEEVDPCLGNPKLRQELSLPELKQSQSFWIIVVALLLSGFAQEGIHQHTKIYLELDLQFGGEVAAWAFSFVMTMSIAGRVIFGWMYDLLSHKGIAICYSTVALSSLLAMFIFGPISLVLFCVLRGLSHGGVLVDSPILLTHAFGRQNLAKLLGIVSGISSFGMALGPAAFGYFHDYFGTYTIPFILTIVAALSSAFLVMRVPPLYWNNPKNPLLTPVSKE